MTDSRFPARAKIKREGSPRIGFYWVYSVKVTGNPVAKIEGVRQTWAAALIAANNYLRKYYQTGKVTQGNITTGGAHGESSSGR